MTQPHVETTERPRGEAGFILVEVLVSAVILIIVSLAAFQTLDQADDLSGNQVKRAQAANMAQAEIERIRSLPIEDVAKLRGTRTVNAFGEEPKPTDKPGRLYKITSTSRWVTDNNSADEAVCTTRSGGLDYMRLTTTVQYDDPDPTKPAANNPNNWVKVSTIVTPASRAASSTNGSLSVNIARADGVTGAAGIAVSITPVGGGTSYTETTNSTGCVVFPFVEAGQYELTFFRDGWVNQNSESRVKETVSVTAGATNKVSYLYDIGGFTRTRFFTYRGNLGGQVNSFPDSMVLFNNDQTPGPLYEQPLVLNPANAEWATRRPLFPSTSPYALYAGACTGNNPGPTRVTNVNITSSIEQNAGATQLPSYDVQVRSGSNLLNGVPLGGANVTFFAGCGTTYSATTLNRGALDPLTGRLADPGFPFTTTGTLCASQGNRKVVVPVNMTAANFSTTPAVYSVYLNGTGSTSGSC